MTRTPAATSNTPAKRPGVNQPPAAPNELSRSARTEITS